MVFVKLHAIEVDSIKGTAIEVNNFVPHFYQNFTGVNMITYLHNFSNSSEPFEWFTRPDTTWIKHDTILKTTPLDTIPLTLYY
jgi:hypothetical protein